MKTSFKAISLVLIAATLFLTLNLVSPMEAVGLLGAAINQPIIREALSPQQTPESDKVVLGGSYILEQNETLEGNLFVLGGTAQLKSGSSVKGDVMVLGGTLVAQGEISGDVSIMGGLANLEEDAHIRGDVNTLSATLQRSDGAVIDGQTNEITSETWPSIIPKNLHLPSWQGSPSIILPGETPTNNYSSPLKTGWDFLWLLVRSLAWAALAVLTALFGPKLVSTASDTAVEKPVVALGMGCLTVFVGTAVLLLLIITICGIPFSLLGGFILLLAWGFGVIAIGTETGIRIAKLFKSDWAIPVSAGVGTLILTLVTNAIAILIPCLGWLLPTGIGLVGLGAAVLTRFGSRPYSPDSLYYEPRIPRSSAQIIEVDSERNQPNDLPPNQQEGINKDT
jgi:hypothetical protein